MASVVVVVQYIQCSTCKKKSQLDLSLFNSGPAKKKVGATCFIPAALETKQKRKIIERNLLIEDKVQMTALGKIVRLLKIIIKKGSASRRRESGIVKRGGVAGGDIKRDWGGAQQA